MPARTPATPPKVPLCPLASCWASGIISSKTMYSIAPAAKPRERARIVGERPPTRANQAIPSEPCQRRPENDFLGITAVIMG